MEKLKANIIYLRQQNDTDRTELLKDVYSSVNTLILTNSPKNDIDSIIKLCLECDEKIIFIGEELSCYYLLIIKKILDEVNKDVDYHLINPLINTFECVYKNVDRVLLKDLIKFKISNDYDYVYFYINNLFINYASLIDKINEKHNQAHIKLVTNSNCIGLVIGEISNSLLLK